jgi:hypothetical protein
MHSKAFSLLLPRHSVKSSTGIQQFRTIRLEGRVPRSNLNADQAGLR